MLNAFAYFHFRTFCFSILQNKMHLQFEVSSHHLLMLCTLMIT